jgi:N-acetylmuramoyl-L-alanine amidase
MQVKRLFLTGAAIVLAGSAAAFQAPSAQPYGGAAAHAAITEHSPAARAAAPVPDSLTWRRPEGPIRIALQAGHWKAGEAPDEQAGLRSNGTRGGGKHEWEVNLEIARRTARLLEGEGLEVEILPTTVPPGYWADLFISIHADGHPSPATSGFRAAAPRRDPTGRAHNFVAVLERRYRDATGLPRYPTITRRMTGYYAFNWRRYTHAVHPMTTGVILETGFLSSPRDRAVILSDPDRAARGIAAAVREYVETIEIDADLVVPTAMLRRRNGELLSLE